MVLPLRRARTNPPIGGCCPAVAPCRRLGRARPGAAAGQVGRRGTDGGAGRAARDWRTALACGAALCPPELGEAAVGGRGGRGRGGTGGRGSPAGLPYVLQSSGPEGVAGGGAGGPGRDWRTRLACGAALCPPESAGGGRGRAGGGCGRPNARLEDGLACGTALCPPESAGGGRRRRCGRPTPVWRTGLACGAALCPPELGAGRRLTRDWRTGLAWGAALCPPEFGRSRRRGWRVGGGGVLAWRADAAFRPRRRRRPGRPRLRAVDVRALAGPAQAPRAGVERGAGDVRVGGGRAGGGGGHRLERAGLPGLLLLRGGGQRAVPGPRHHLSAGRTPAGRHVGGGHRPGRGLRRRRDRHHAAHRPHPRRCAHPPGVGRLRAAASHPGRASRRGAAPSLCSAEPCGARCATGPGAWWRPTR